MTWFTVAHYSLDMPDGINFSLQAMLFIMYESLFESFCLSAHILADSAEALPRIYPYRICVISGLMDL